MSQAGSLSRGLSRVGKLTRPVLRGLGADNSLLATRLAFFIIFFSYIF